MAEQQKRKGVVGVIVAGLIVAGVVSAGDNPQTPQTPKTELSPTTSTSAPRNLEAGVLPAQATTPDPAPTNTNSNLSNDNYYTNSAGNTVHSPAYSDTVPAGATAKCKDGTYSFSQSRRGTCSHHGGVASWL